ncbi:MAG TPA: AMP-binding protein [Rhizomicrobium sp.]|nr:AMP-binding protein [Rhizomicrobium sp.]
MAEPWSGKRLLAALAERQGAPALISVREGMLETLSGMELASRARAFASALLRSGMGRGEPVVLIGANCSSWVIARLALSVSGALAIPVDETSGDDTLGEVLTRCKARRAVCDPGHAERLKRLAPMLEIVRFGAEMERMCAGAAVPLPETAPNEPDMLAYTSGTTGSPKTIVLTHANIAANVEPLAASHLVGPADRVLLPLPLAHVYPYVVGLLAGLASGAAIVFPQTQTGPDILAAARLSDATTIVGVPRLYAAICSGLMARLQDANPVARTLFRASLAASTRLRRMGVNSGLLLLRGARARFGTKLRLLVSGGARMDPATLWTLLGLGYDVRTGYGLAETASMFTGNLPNATRWESEGKPFAGDVRIAAPDTDGLGEIELRGPQVFSRYLDNTDATRAAFTADGWFRTGDLGRLDNEGFLFVAKRMRDVLVLGGGKKVDPEALEKLYGDHPGIREMAVLEYKGALVALIVPAPEAARSGGALHIETAIRVHLASIAQTLPPFMRLAGYAIAREPLPRTRLGKYRRFLLPQTYERALHPAAPPTAISAEDRALLERPLPQKVFQTLRGRYPGRSITPDANLQLDLGIDSLEWMALALELEERLHIHLDEAQIASLVTIRDLLEVVEQASPSSVPAGRDWAAPRGALLRILGRMVYALDRAVMGAAFQLRVYGKENLPRRGNFLLIANHVSYLDAPALAAALETRVLSDTYWAGDPQLLFSKPWQAPLMRAMQCYPLDERQPAQALAASSGLLERGANIVWFPEGWRSPDGTLQDFLPGIGHLLKRHPVSVVPAYIEGAFDAWPRHRAWPRPLPLRVTFGKPIEPDAWRNEDDPRKIAKLLHDAVSALKS